MSSSRITPHPEWATRHRQPGTELKKINGRYYLYAVGSSYDPATKKTRKISLGIIGHISEKDGLVPSEKKQLKDKLKDVSARVNDVSDKEYGFSFYFNQQAQHQIVPALKEHFPDDWQMILALAYCRMLHHAPLKNIPFHLRRSSLPELLGIEYPDEQLASRTLRKIGALRDSTVKYMRGFADDDDCVLVDATDITCNSARISLSKKGYNSDMSFAPQITLLYIYSTKKHKPFFFRLVPGNIKDVSILKNALIESGISNAVFIADKGFYSQANTERLDNLLMKYIIPLRRDNVAIDYALLSNIETTSNYFKFRKRYIFYTSYPSNGKQICLFLDGSLKEDEKTDYLNRITTIPEKYTKKGYGEKIQKMGTIALLHNSIETESPEDIYVNYKSRGEIEQFFDCYKNTLGADASHMQNQDALHGWVFINHIAMQVTYNLFEQLKAKKLTKWHSINDVIMHLAQIRKVKVNDDTHFISEIDRETKNILAKLKISVT